MDILDLRYFIAAYDTGSYARAADKLFVSRQALRQNCSVWKKKSVTLYSHRAPNIWSPPT